MRDAWLLAVGTLTAVRVPPPSAVTPRVAGAAMVLAPLAVLPLGGAVLVVGLLGVGLGLPPLVTALLALAAVAVGTRALHWDGLSDVADGLVSSYDRERSLAVMRTGTSGPAGVVTTVLVLGVQAAAGATLMTSARGAVTAAVLVCLSRAALVLCCVRGVPGARDGGLGASYVGTVRTPVALVVWMVVGLLAGLAAGSGGVVGAGLAVVVVGALVHRAVHRLGGVTGDVLGAAVELALAALLVGASTR